MGILAVDIRMVLSGMGTELLTERFLRQDKHTLYCLYSRNLPDICRQLYRQAKRFLYGHHLHWRATCLPGKRIRIQPNQWYAGGTPPSSLFSTCENHAFHPVHFHGRRHGKHGTLLLRIYTERWFAPVAISRYLCPRAGPPTGHHQWGWSKTFYAYQVCTRSQVKEIRFSGYFSVLSHVLGNARRLMTEEEYAELFSRIRPEIIELAQKNQQYWMEKYSPLIGDIQNFIYDLYLKGNKIQSGRKNYSEVIGLLISYEEWKN